jgi:hypothetical protein
MEVFERKIVNVTSRENVIPGIRVTASSIFSQNENGDDFSPLTYYLGTRGYEIISEELIIVEIDFSIFSPNSSVFRIEGSYYLKITNYHGSYKRLTEVFSFDLSPLSVGLSNCSLFFEPIGSEPVARNFISDSSVSVFTTSTLNEVIDADGEDFHTMWKMMEDPDIFAKLSEITGLTNNDLQRLARVRSMALD